MLYKCRPSLSQYQIAMEATRLCKSPLPTPGIKLSTGQKYLRSHMLIVAKSGGGKQSEAQEDDKEKKKGSLFGSIVEALDFAQVRSEKDAELLDQARQQTRGGEQMSREQYGALRRKIGGTYKDFFKDSIEVKGAYVDDGWVDKTCKICKKDTTSGARAKDASGRYVHVACLETQKSKASTNIFTQFFGR